MDDERFFVFFGYLYLSYKNFFLKLFFGFFFIFPLRQPIIIQPTLAHSHNFTLRRKLIKCGKLSRITYIVFGFVWMNADTCPTVFTTFHKFNRQLAVWYITTYANQL